MNELIRVYYTESQLLVTENKRLVAKKECLMAKNQLLSTEKKVLVAYNERLRRSSCPFICGFLYRGYGLPPTTRDQPTGGKPPGNRRSLANVFF